MIEQLVVFTPQGQVLYKFNPLRKRFAEQQINKIVCQLISTSARKEEGGKFPVLELDGFACMYHAMKQPRLYFVVTYAASSLELNQEAEQVLQLGTRLWESLELNDKIIHNLNGKGPRNKHNYTWILDDGEAELDKFDEYFKIKFEEANALNSKNSSRKAPTPQLKAKNGKKQLQIQPGAKTRKWGRDGIMEEVSTADSSALDFSEGTSDSSQVTVTDLDKSSFGNRTDNGEFLIKEIDELLSKNKSEKIKQANSEGGTFGFLQKHLFGNKTITEADLKTVLQKLKQKLITKNVAPEVADYLANQISQDLVGSKTANWTSVEATAKESLEKSLTKILTPGVSVDLLHEIQQKTGSKDSNGRKNPYVFSVVGVNGVGKSTNLSKLAFWLLQNNLKVLIVACDTFRSGAVEQLRVHVENLAQLTDETHTRGSKNSRGKTGNDFVELFEGGYGGSDLVTKIAKQAIKYAKDQDFDIVLMDTAGRRHNDPTLMSPLKSFAEQARPDKIIMVGEALVGTDSVQQAKNFNAAFGKERNLDFFIISKCDTVGEMLGTMVNMVYATGIPILFVGVGQTYTDLRTLSVQWAVDTLMY
ncbi:LAFE_0F12332g1_1 [Lachancea fermentati]|uniref:Signal recognition particle receptor subunit alpha homolog n=1 Tax=Lachancea fermentati TaxID=4955 RepID=A0A1G4MFP5_LACFM|nr:LAFE_0F12332g1_1 [Lachancea fermentati]